MKTSHKIICLYRTPEHKGIPVHGLYCTWKTFSLLYGRSTVNPVCCDAAYDSCGPLSYAPHADQHPSGEPTNRVRHGYPVGSVTKKVVLLPTEPIIQGGCLLLFNLYLMH